jgi:hypothetical protein
MRRGSQILSRCWVSGRDRHHHGAVAQKAVSIGLTAMSKDTVVGWKLDVVIS